MVQTPETRCALNIASLSWASWLLTANGLSWLSSRLPVHEGGDFGTCVDHALKAGEKLSSYFRVLFAEYDLNEATL